MQDAGGIPRPRLEREHRYLQLLVRAGEILSTALDWHQTIGSVCAAAVETVADICLLDLVGNADDVELAAAVHTDPARTIELRDAGRFLHSSRATPHPVATVIATGRSLLVPAVDDAFLRARATSPEHEQFMRHMGYRSLMVVPLISRSHGIIGALTLVRTTDSDESYDAESLRFAEDLARRCAQAIAKARLYEQTLHIATQYQRAALPAHLPKCEGMAFDAFYEPSSEELLVGGDWYDAFELPDGRIAVTIGDVQGHGIEAALRMSQLRSGFRAALFAMPDAANALDIGDLMLRVESREEFTTACVALIDPSHFTLSCASAGHPGPLIWDGSGRVLDPFLQRGLPLGLRDLAPSDIVSQTLQLRPGSFATFFTDGLLEWNRDTDESSSRLIAAIARRQVRQALHPANAIRENVLGASPHDDDVAILTVRWEEPGQVREATSR